MTTWTAVLALLVLPEGYALSPMGYFAILDQLPKRVALAILIMVYGFLYGIIHLFIQLVRIFRDWWIWTLLDP